MAELSDIANETIREEIEEYLERPEEIERSIELFARASPKMQDIAAAIIEGDDDEVFVDLTEDCVIRRGGERLMPGDLRPGMSLLLPSYAPVVAAIEVLERSGPTSP